MGGFLRAQERRQEVRTEGLSPQSKSAIINRYYHRRRGRDCARAGDYRILFLRRYSSVGAAAVGRLAAVRRRRCVSGGSGMASGGAALEMLSPWAAHSTAAGGVAGLFHRLLQAGAPAGGAALRRGVGVHRHRVRLAGRDGARRHGHGASGGLPQSQGGALRRGGAADAAPRQHRHRHGAVAVRRPHPRQRRDPFQCAGRVRPAVQP